MNATNTSLLPTDNSQNTFAEPGVFTFRVLQVTEALALGEGARSCVSLFGDVFQRVDNSTQPRRLASGRVEFDPVERNQGYVGRFSFPPETEIQPFFLAYIDVRPSAMPELIETLRSGPGIELAFRADIDKSLIDILAQEKTPEDSQPGVEFKIRTVSVSVSR